MISAGQPFTALNLRVHLGKCQMSYSLILVQRKGLDPLDSAALQAVVETAHKSWPRLIAAFTSVELVDCALNYDRILAGQSLNDEMHFIDDLGGVVHVGQTFNAAIAVGSDSAFEDVGIPAGHLISLRSMSG
jgi:hypothetical protein